MFHLFCLLAFLTFFFWGQRDQEFSSSHQSAASRSGTEQSAENASAILSLRVPLLLQDVAASPAGVLAPSGLADAIPSLSAPVAAPAEPSSVSPLAGAGTPIDLAAPDPATEAASLPSQGIKWEWVDIHALPQDGRGARRPQQRFNWKLIGFQSEEFFAGNFANKEFEDYFYAVFPMSYLYSTIVSLTNDKLGKYNHIFTTPGELVKFIGVLILMSFHEFGGRDELWRRGPDPLNPFIEGADLGRVISKNRFEQLLKCLTVSDQSPQPSDPEATRTELRWRAVSGLAEALNSHKATCFTPGPVLCQDESFARWYGMGGLWSAIGIIPDLEPCPHLWLTLHLLARLASLRCDGPQAGEWM